MAARFAHKQFQTPMLALRRKEEELLPAQAKQAQPSLIALQRYVGNAGIQRLLNTPSIHLHAQTNMLHRKGCGCSSCSGKSEDEQVLRKLDGDIQRFWGDEEEESEGGGGWFDNAVDTVSDWVSGDNDSSNTSGGGSSNVGSDEGEEYQETDWPQQEEHHEQQNESEQSNENESDEGGGSWWDNAVDTVKDWWNGDEESESESSEGSGGVMDWLEDWWNGDESEGSETETGGDVQHTDEEDEISHGHGACVTPAVGHGGGSTGGVSVAGLTSANFKHSKSYGYAGGGAYTNKAGESVEDITIDLTVTYTSNPQIDFTITPDYSTLSECKQKAVDAFKAPSGDLGKHEQKHVDAFKSYNGKENKKFKVTVPADSAASEAETKAEEKATELNDAREQAARDKSDKLDPWSKAIPNIEKCVDPPKSEDSESESESE